MSSTKTLCFRSALLLASDSDPCGVSCAAVEGRGEGGGRAEIVDGAGEAILEYSVGIDYFPCRSG
jgi:hypothetical protein